ncbi:hypothetical protein ACFFLM_18200 [Deinococcus oregonensis]|uniref:Uncharacterized protein n=1 Tax=Deinococcus oregonensis TaxID=1805970 RepID=A0ABV6B2A4_9DEIO
MTVATELRTLFVQYQSHPLRADISFLKGVVLVQAHAIDPTLPQPFSLRGRPDEAREWPLLFWWFVEHRADEDEAAQQWSNAVSAQQVLLNWVADVIRRTQNLTAAWQAQETLERNVWGAADFDLYRGVQAELAHIQQRLAVFETAVRQGEFQARHARYVVWLAHQQVKTQMAFSQPAQQVRRLISEVEQVLSRVSAS